MTTSSVPTPDLKQLFLRYAKGLQKRLQLKSRDPNLASDLVQESFLRLGEQMHKESIDNPSAYLYRISHNLLVNHQRQQAQRRTDSLPFEAMGEIEDPALSLEEQVSQQRLLALLRSTLDELPLRTRQIYQLCRLEGMTHQEAAKHLGISTSSVQKHLAIAVEYVMQRFG